MVKMPDRELMDKLEYIVRERNKSFQDLSTYPKTLLRIANGLGYDNKKAGYAIHTLILEGRLRLTPEGYKAMKLK